MYFKSRGLKRIKGLVVLDHIYRVWIGGETEWTHWLQDENFSVCFSSSELIFPSLFSSCFYFFPFFSFTSDCNQGIYIVAFDIWYLVFIKNTDHVFMRILLNIVSSGNTFIKCLIVNSVVQIQHIGYNIWNYPQIMLPCNGKLQATTNITPKVWKVELRVNN